MAIAFIKITFLHLRADASATKLVAYLGRRNVQDHRLRRYWAFRRHGRDRVFERVFLPDQADTNLARPVIFARQLDDVEAGRTRRMEGRQRWPQLGAGFVVALPPDSELTYDEVIELTGRLVDRIRMGRPIAVYAVVHDPARERRGAINRHAHLFVPLRAVDGQAFTKKKERGLFARPRTGGRNHQYISEAVNWPRLHAQLQNGFFIELGLDVRVDPYLPVGHAHWTETALHTEPERVAAHRDRIDAENRVVCLGAADVLIERLLRGRSTLPVPELRHVLTRVLGGRGAEERLNEILLDSAVVTYAIHPDDTRPSRIALKSTHDLIRRATSAVEDLGRETSRLIAVVKPSRRDVTDGLVEMIRGLPPLPRVIVGQKLSEAEELHVALPGGAVMTIKTLLEDGLARLDNRNALVVVPAGEAVDDVLMAELVLAVQREGGRLVIGFSESRSVSLSSNQLSARIADRYDRPAPSVADAQSTTIVEWLRCGLVDRALEALATKGCLRFGEEAAVDAGGVDFIVSDDWPRVDKINRGTATLNTVKTPHVDHGPYALIEGEWIVFERTDYTRIPPVIGAGRLARIVTAVPNSGQLIVDHVNQEREEINLAHFNAIRPARALTIREARYAPQNARLSVELTKARCALACLLLAAAREGFVTLAVNPRVALDLSELKRAIHRALPSALPDELYLQVDSYAKLDQLLSGAMSPTLPPDEDPLAGIEMMPEPGSASALVIARQPFVVRREEAAPLRTNIPQNRLHDSVWAALEDLKDDGQLALDCLTQTLAIGNPRRESFMDDIRRSYGRHGLMAEFAIAAMDSGENPQRRVTVGEDILEPEAPALAREWTAYELSQFVQHIRLIRFDPFWAEALKNMLPRPDDATDNNEQNLQPPL